jgi:enoyl-CoA hydratase
MEFSKYRAMTFRRDGRVLNATFNRPDTMNAMDDDLQTDLERLFADVTHDPETHVLVLSGAGRAFSAGGNLEEMQLCIEQPELFREGTERGKRHIMAIVDCPKPIIAKINGPAIGLGATLALFCDVAIAAKTARIADPHVQVGLSAGDGGAVIWPALLGFARAKAHLLTGDAITGEEAERIGLIYRAVDSAQLDQVTTEFAQRLANGASQAIRMTKLCVNIGLKSFIDAVLDKSFELELLTQRSKDHKEAVAAFRAKRAPRFTGE